MATITNGSRQGALSNSVLGATANHTGFENSPQTPTDTGPSTKLGLIRRSSILLADDPFDSEYSKLLFEAIDQLRTCGVGPDLGLPQLVIVGKQSVGKSSLLEGLTEIPFPVGKKLCTQFATRIISRRTPPNTVDMINVSVEKGDVDPFGDSAADGQTGSFKPNIQHPMTAENFNDVINQARVAMGITTGTGGASKNFSSKVLKIELSGPGRSQFGILDLPGIFGAATGDVTEDERIGVDKLVTAYMKRPQNIIIAVSDTDDLANQRILKLAAEHVDEERLVGVITKCDQASDPENIVSIVQNSEGTSGKPLYHGWFVVQNRGQHDNPDTFDRDEAERLIFGKAPWVNINEERRGTAKLKTFLSRLLCKRIRERFPEMQRTVQEQLEINKEKKDKLGNPRSSISLQKEYLFAIVQKFQSMAIKALKNPEELPSEEMKLRGNAQTAKTNFAENLRLHGHYFAFSDPATEGSIESLNRKKNDALYCEIRSQIKQNRGEELRGMINPAVMKPLLRKQASKWLDLAKQHLESLTRMTDQVVMRILAEACKDFGGAEYTQGELETIIANFAVEARKSALQKLDARWREEMLHPGTDNPAFDKNVKTAREYRFSNAVVRYMKKIPAQNFLAPLFNDVKDPAYVKTVQQAWSRWAVVSLDTLPALFAELHSHTEQNTEDEIHDLLKAYYEVALEDFISYVNRYIAEAFLYDPAGPLLGLTTEFVNHLPNDKIQQYGAEHETTTKKREKLEETIKRLEDAKRIAEETMQKTKVLAGAKVRYLD